MHNPGTGWSQAYNMKYERDSHAQRAANLQADLQVVEKNYKSWKAYAQKLEQRIEILTLKFQVEQCNAEGLIDEVVKMRELIEKGDLEGLKKLWEEHPNLPPFKSGTPRKNIHEIYNTGFDNKAENLGLKEPEKYRDT